MRRNPGLVAVPAGGGTLPEGRWAPVGSLRRLDGPCSADGPALYQREGSVAVVRVRDELRLFVAAGGRDTVDLDDGSRIELDGDRLRVRGPERDLLVIADGRHALRVRCTEAELDIAPATELLARAAALPSPSHGWASDAWAAVRAAAAADASRPLRHAYDVRPDPPGDGEPAVVVLHGDPGRARVLVDGRTEIEMRPGPRGWTAHLPPAPAGTVVRYRIEAGEPPALVDDAGPVFEYPSLGTPFVRAPSTRFSYAVHDPAVPAWARDAVVYHALVDRFAAADGAPLPPADALSWLGFAGGTVRGLTQRIGYVASLGVDALLVSPLHRGEMHVCYDVTDLDAVEPRFGTADDVRALCREAHGHGLRILLDLEMAYAGTRHPWFLAARDDPSSPYRAWFRWLPSGEQFGWMANRMLVPFDHDHPSVREHLIGAARWWLDLGFDGFRLDSAHAASFDFWTDFGAAVREHRPDAFTFAECPRRPEERARYRGRLHGVLDFELSAAIRAAAAGTGDAAALDAAVRARAAAPDGLAPVGFAESHDVDRLAHVCGGDERRIRLALGLLLALPGPQILYYGTEAGLGQPGRGDVDLVARLPMRWDALDEDRIAFLRGLLTRRRAAAAMRSGVYEPLVVDGSRWAFMLSGDGERIVLAANLAPVSQRITIPGVGETDVPALSVVQAPAPDAYGCNGGSWSE